MADKRDDIELEDDKKTSEQPDRGMPSISKKKKAGDGSSVSQKVVLSIIAILVVLALIAVNGGFSSDEEKTTKPKSEQPVANLLGPAPDLPPPPAPPKPKETTSEADTMVHTGIAPPPPSSASGKKGDKDEVTPEERKRAKSLLAFGNISKPGNAAAGNGSSDQEANTQAVSLQAEKDSSLSENDTADSLNKRLKGAQLNGSRASVMRNRSYFITQGAFLGCSLETAMSSDVPGMVTCRLTRDVYGTDNKVLLLEHGSKVVGQYQGGVQRGKSRIFVVWTRIETPNGVLVNLDSPGADGLGRSGLDGFLDTHFWDRFGSAIMLSTIDNGGQYLANKASGGSNGNNQFNFGGTTDTAKDMAGIALENQINIPNTLTKNQGDYINIFVARDLDFRGAYELQAR